MRLYLLRHGPAAQPDLATQDDRRPLTQAGMDLMTPALQHHVQHLPKLHHLWCRHAFGHDRPPTSWRKLSTAETRKREKPVACWSPKNGMT